ncbi:MAG: hypothetical protein AAFQ35_05785, partial [Pseudomonadota bacterium]
FKSLSGQVRRVAEGKSFLVFGDGRSTACKPISDADLAGVLVDCLARIDVADKTIVAGGPGPAIMPVDQAAMLADLLGRAVAIRRIPLGLVRSIRATLGAFARMTPRGLKRVQTAAEFARIAEYYASESMLVLNPETGAYDGAATPEYGTDTLDAHYARLLEAHRRGVDMDDAAQWERVDTPLF